MIILRIVTELSACNALQLQRAWPQSFCDRFQTTKHLPLFFLIQLSPHLGAEGFHSIEAI